MVISKTVFNPLVFQMTFPARFTSKDLLVYTCFLCSLLHIDVLTLKNFHGICQCFMFWIQIHRCALPVDFFWYPQGKVILLTRCSNYFSSLSLLLFYSIGFAIPCSSSDNHVFGVQIPVVALFSMTRGSFKYRKLLPLRSDPRRCVCVPQILSPAPWHFDHGSVWLGNQDIDS